MLDLYSDYLIFQNKQATVIGLSDLVDGGFGQQITILASLALTI